MGPSKDFLSILLYISNSKTFLNETMFFTTDPSIKHLLLLQEFGVIWMSIERKSIWQSALLMNVVYIVFLSGDL